MAERLYKVVWTDNAGASHEQGGLTKAAAEQVWQGVIARYDGVKGPDGGTFHVDPSILPDFNPPGLLKRRPGYPAATTPQRPKTAPPPPPKDVVIEDGESIDPDFVQVVETWRRK